MLSYVVKSTKNKCKFTKYKLVIIFQKFISDIYCFRYSLTVRSAQFGNAYLTIPNSEWFHVVFNFIGPNFREGYRVYHDGQLVAEKVVIASSVRAQALDRKIVIGRQFTEVDGFYSSLIMDELMFFNRTLTDREIQVLSL